MKVTISSREKRHPLAHATGILALILLFSSLFSLSSHAILIERILAIVNDEIITLSDLTEYRSQLKSKGLRDQTLLGLRDVNELLKSDSSLIQHLIDERILDSEIKRKGLSVTIERVEQEIRSIASRNGVNRNQLKASLSAQGISMSEYQDFLKRSLERQSLIEQEVSSKIKISDDDVVSYLITREGRKDLQIYAYSLSQILFRTQKGGETAALSRAQRAAEKITSNNFEELTSQFSEDPNFVDGGVLGTFHKNEMIPEFQTVVEKMSVGDVSPIVKTKFGYHILKLTKKTLVQDPRLDALREDVKKKLFSEVFQSYLKDWLSQKRSELFIKINS